MGEIVDKTKGKITQAVGDLTSNKSSSERAAVTIGIDGDNNNKWKTCK